MGNKPQKAEHFHLAKEPLLLKWFCILYKIHFEILNQVQWVFTYNWIYIKNVNIFYFQNIFSSGKSLEAIAVATLFDKGLFNYEDTIAKYWPEFAQNGKENVKICDVLRHESGLAYFQGNLLTDIDKKTCRSQIKLQPTSWQYPLINYLTYF